MDCIPIINDNGGQCLGIDCTYGTVTVSSTHYPYGLFNSHISAPRHTVIHGLPSCERSNNLPKDPSYWASRLGITLNPWAGSRAPRPPGALPTTQCLPPKGGSLSCCYRQLICAVPQCLRIHHKAALLVEETPGNLISQTKRLWVTDRWFLGTAKEPLFARATAAAASRRLHVSGWHSQTVHIVPAWGQQALGI